MHVILKWLVVLTFPLTVLAQRPGETWTTRRGDATPGLSYSATVATSSGRLIAVGQGGALMISDDRGATWRFEQIEIGGAPARGTFTDIFQVPDGALIALAKRLEESSVGFFSHYIRTYFVTSTDNGNSWREEPFPVESARFRGGGRPFYGVNINGLTMGPGGQLLAYGTTSGTSNPGFVLWSIGGAIFRQSGDSWVQAYFENGPVSKIANAGGRAVAAAYNAVLDSSDGAGWNGYRLTDALINLGNSVMSADQQRRLRLLDIGFVDGTYIAQSGTFLPFPGIPYIDTNIADGLFTLTSPTPFSGARNWTAQQETVYHGPFTEVAGGILAGSGNGVFRAGSTGSFALEDATVQTNGRTIASISDGGAVAVRSSETAWTSSSAGNWTKTWDKDPGPNLRVLSTVGGTVFAAGGRNELWKSRDNGESWQLNAGEFPGFRTLTPGANGRLFAPVGGNRVTFSDDGGDTWTITENFVERGGGISHIVRSQTGRLIAAAEGRDVRNQGAFYVSDDNGETWEPRNAGIGWGEDPADLIQTKSGRLIVPSAFNLPFFPELNFSDDDGDTWRSSNVLQRTQGLNLVSGSDVERVIDIAKLIPGSSGRILMLGDDEILTSDDDGETWIVRTNLEFPFVPPNLSMELRDVIEAGPRWIAVGSYRMPFPQRRNKQFLLVSDDDGATWGQVPFETNQPTTYLDTLAVVGNRVVITGGNGSVYTSDFTVPLETSAPEQSLREANSGTILVSRPDAEGAVTASYRTVGLSAVSGTDFTPASGTLEWTAGDRSGKTVTVTALDNATRDADHTFTVELSYETADGLVGAIETPVAIEDDDSGGGAGFVFDGATEVRTTEAGTTATIRVALEVRPSTTVVVTITGLDTTEGSLSQETLTFTPENWNIFQAITVTGVEDTYYDGDTTYDLVFTPATEEEAYADVPRTCVAVTNTSDERYVCGGEFFDRLGPAYIAWTEREGIPVDDSGPFSDPNRDGIANVAAYAFGISPVGSRAGTGITINANRNVTFRVPASVENLTFTTQTATDLKVTSWTTGPAPAPGAPSGGFIPYTAALPADALANFVRIVIGIAE